MLSLRDLTAMAAAADDVLARLRNANPADMQAIARATAQRDAARADMREAFAYRCRLLGVAL